jgi:CelD/BcsL family acetyltransferase involved in cellulose biosynthesis
MHIQCIKDMHQMDALKEAWDAAYAVDPYATIFASWAWLRGWLETTCDEWLVLAARSDSGSSYVAFLTLAVDATRRRLYMGGYPLADHTGFVCLPEYEGEAIAALAAFVQQQLEWDEFDMRDVCDPRLDRFLGHLSQTRFDIRKTDGACCPYILLPESWEQYLQDSLGRKARKNLRRSTRKVESLSGFRMTQAQADNIEHQIDVFLMLYQMRWGAKAGYFLDRFRAIFRRCFESDCLWLVVLWDGATPIATDAAFVDRQKKVFSVYVGGWDERFARLSPGDVLTGYSIRYAIENGFQVVDLLRGAESYKISFGAEEHFNTDVTVARKSLRVTARKLARRLRRSLSPKPGGSLV